MTTKGGGGTKIPKNLTTWFMNDPQYKKKEFLSLASFCYYDGDQWNKSVCQVPEDYFWIARDFFFCHSR